LKRDEFNYSLLKERLIAMKFLYKDEKSIPKQHLSEIVYIENLLMAEKITEERKKL